MKKFCEANLESGLLLGVRNLGNYDHFISKGIRSVLNSYTNHSAIIFKYNTNGYVIGDTNPPKSKIVSLESYEKLINDGKIDVRVWKIPNITEFEKKRLGCIWQKDIDGKDYDEISVLKLCIMRIVNSLPFRIKGNWCTRSIGVCCQKVLQDQHNPFRKPYTNPIKLKFNETPRTLENRLVCGFLIDVTDKVIVRA